MVELAQQRNTAPHRKGEATHGAILDHALDLASVHGLEGISIGALARETGLSKSGLFAHFGSKEALQLAVLEVASARFAAQVIKPSRDEARGLRRLIALVENWMNWANSETLSGGCPFVAAQVEWDDREGPVRDYLVWAQQTWLAVLGAAAEKAVAQGDFRDDLDTRAFAHDIYAIALGYHNAQRLLRDQGSSKLVPRTASLRTSMPSTGPPVRSPKMMN